MLSDINSKAAERILELLKADPIAFIGAGLSKPYYKDWPELIEQLSELMQLQCTPDIDPIIQAQELRIADEKKYIQALISIFGKYPPNCSDSLFRLVKCGFKSYVTTNFDWSIELALQQDCRPPSEVLSYPNLPSTIYCESGAIHHIHGTIDASAPEESVLILDADSYNDAYGGNSALGNYLFDVFFRHNLLFVGYSLAPSEPINGILDLVARRVDEYEIRLKKKFIKNNWCCLCATPIDERNIERIKRLGIEIIEYDPVCQSFSGLSQIWKHVSDMHRPIPPLEPPSIFNPNDGLKKPDFLKR